MSHKKMTHAELGDKYKVARETVSRWKAEGIDIYDERAVANHARKDTGIQGELFPINGTLHEQLDAVANLKDAQFIKTKIEAKKHLHALEVSEGSHIRNSEVKESTIRILSILKAGMQKLESDLPNKLYGLDAADIQKEIRAATTSLLTQFNEIALREFGE